MNLLPIDLHVHSTRSDGTYTPSELVDYAMEKGLAAFALTDHDTVDGLEEAVSYAEGLRESRTRSSAAQKEAANPKYDSAQGNFFPAEYGDAPKNHSHPEDSVARKTFSSADPGQKTDSTQRFTKVPEVIPGIEFSTEYQGQDVHVLGYYIDYRQEAFRDRLREFVDSRDRRNQKMCRLLQEAGVEITYEALLQEFPDSVITRAHYAKYLLTHGYVSGMKEAFDRYVGDHCPCYVPREKVTPVQAVKLILAVGGIPVLAHPILYHMSDARLDALTAELTENGLMGIEAVYSTYKACEERQIRALAKKYGLLITGGSDFHGGNKPGLDLGTGYGNLFVPSTLLDELKQAKSGR
ncbi:MAG: PHP domain-containing protein [bacterium]|nr:PHP domain-containing protein [bacterium]